MYPLCSIGTAWTICRANRIIRTPQISRLSYCKQRWCIPYQQSKYKQLISQTSDRSNRIYSLTTVECFSMIQKRNKSNFAAQKQHICGFTYDLGKKIRHVRRYVDWQITQWRPTNFRPYLASEAKSSRDFFIGYKIFQQGFEATIMSLMWQTHKHRVNQLDYA